MNLPPRKVPHEGDPKSLKGAGICEPEIEPATLKSAAPGHLEVKTSHSQGEQPWKGIADPKGSHPEATEPRSRGSSPAEKEDKLQNQNRVSMDGTVYTDAHSPSFPFSFVLGHSCSGYRPSFRAPTEGRRRRCQRWSWRTEPSNDAWQVTHHPSHRHAHSCAHTQSQAANRQHTTHHASQHVHQNTPVIQAFNNKWNISLQSQTMCEMRGSVEIEHGTR